VTAIRLTIGVAARITTWAIVFLIVGNAMYQAIDDDTVFVAILEAAVFPITFFVYPFVAEGAYSAWPFADGTNLIPFLVAALILYPVSTVVGGLGPMEADGGPMTDRW
jgi:hypothetical protein